MLATLIALSGPVGGHADPAVSLVQAVRRALVLAGRGCLLLLFQVLGCCVGVFSLTRCSTFRGCSHPSHAHRAAQWLAEGVATFGLLLVVIGHRRAEDASWMVAAWIGAAYWFTASTSFANPAITIARSLSDTFPGSPSMCLIHRRPAGRHRYCVTDREAPVRRKPRPLWGELRSRGVKWHSAGGGEFMSEESVPVTIYHNPACGTSRNTLGLIRNAGIKPAVIEYLKTSPSLATP